MHNKLPVLLPVTQISIFNNKISQLIESKREIAVYEAL